MSDRYVWRIQPVNKKRQPVGNLIDIFLDCLPTREGYYCISIPVYWPAGKTERQDKEIWGIWNMLLKRGIIFEGFYLASHRVAKR